MPSHAKTQLLPSLRAGSLPLPHAGEGRDGRAENVGDFI